MGDAGGPGGSAARLNDQVRGAYDVTATMWAEGPDRMYRGLARALLASPGVPADLSVGMLRHCPARAIPAAAGFAGVRVRTITVATGLSTPAQLAGWRPGGRRVTPQRVDEHVGRLGGRGRARHRGRLARSEQLRPGLTAPAARFLTIHRAGQS